MAFACLIALPVIGQDEVDSQTAQSGQTAQTVQVPGERSILDPTLVILDQQLDQLMEGDLPESVGVNGLFGVPLDDPKKVGQRVEELTLQLVESKRQLEDLRAKLDDLDAQQKVDLAPVPPIPPLAPETLPIPDPGEDERVAAPSRSEDPDALDEQLDAAGSLEADAAIEEAERLREEASRRAQEQAALSEAYAAEVLARGKRAQQREERRAELESQIPSVRLRLEVARKRLAYLTRLDGRLGLMTDASRRVLPSLGKPRAAMRSHAAGLAELAAAARDLSDRMDVLAERTAAGMIVGFVSEQRELSAEMSAGATAHRSQALRLDSLSRDLIELAESLEAEGRRVRSSFFRAVARDDRQPVMDALFDSHLKATRRLRNSVNEAFTSAGRESLLTLQRAAEAIAPDPLAIGTTGDERRALETAAEHRLGLDSLATKEAASLLAWELAFENELMTVLSEYASEEARAGAYAFSREILDDVVSEASIAWNRTLEGMKEEQAAFPNVTTLATTPRGQGLLARFAGILSVIAGWLFLNRWTPKLTVMIVKSLSKIPSMRWRVGRLVRWSGLVQSVLPSLFALVGLQCVLLLIGRNSEVAHVVRVLALPALLYVLGRQILVGATRRITTGRPALIALRPETLARLQRTYASVGIVVAVSYALDGLVRVVIGDGRVVSLIDSVVLFWLFVWGVWEAVRWRAPLALAWSQLIAEDETKSSEYRVMSWMKDSRAGFVLSPVALVRVLTTPIVGLFTGFASSTGFVQSLRARLLRRRSAQTDPASKKSVDELPDEYLAAFPLYPILGEDDALLVPRGALLDDIIAQWKRWQETRADGSLALIGEKGAGKTTLAAQVARRVGQDQVTQHTIRDKPKSATDLVENLSEALGIEGAENVEELIRLICAGEERVVLLDEVHNVFLRFVDGYRAYDALVDIVNSTTSKVFWVLIFNSFTWQFLNESRGRVQYFRRLIQLPKWTPDEIERLIRLRNKRTGYELRFDEMLLSDARSDSANIALVEEADGYFRLLWESSGGNPRIATHLWLASLSPAADKQLRVGLFPEPSTEVLSVLQDELVFSLAAICQHENLTDDELAVVLNVSDGFARFAMKFLLESRFIEPKDASSERYTLAPIYYRAVLRALKNKHLLFE